MYSQSKRFSKQVSVLIGLTLVLVATLVFFNVNRVSVYKELIALDLVPKPETLTELYFNNSAALPSSVADNQVVSFAFVVHNLEMRDYQYTYHVFVNTNGTKLIVDSGNILVKNNQYYVINEKIKFMNVAERQEVGVELVNKQQLIDFWIE